MQCSLTYCETLDEFHTSYGALIFKVYVQVYTGIYVQVQLETLRAFIADGPLFCTLTKTFNVFSTIRS